MTSCHLAVCYLLSREFGAKLCRQKPQLHEMQQAGRPVAAMLGISRNTCAICNYLHCVVEFITFISQRQNNYKIIAKVLVTVNF